MTYERLVHLVPVDGHIDYLSMIDRNKISPNKANAVGINEW